MKKILFFIMLLVLSLALVGCGEFTVDKSEWGENPNEDYRDYVADNKSDISNEAYLKQLKQKNREHASKLVNTVSQMLHEILEKRSQVRISEEIPNMSDFTKANSASDIKAIEKQYRRLIRKVDSEEKRQELQDILDESFKSYQEEEIK